MDPDIDSSVVHIENSNEAVVVNGKHFALVILATGVAIDPYEYTLQHVVCACSVTHYIYAKETDIVAYCRL